MQDVIFYRYNGLSAKYQRRAGDRSAQLTGLEIHFFGGSKFLLPGARPGSKTNFVVAKLYEYFLRNENRLIL